MSSNGAGGGLGDYIVGQATGVGYNAYSSLGAQHAYKAPPVTAPSYSRRGYAPQPSQTNYVPEPRPLTEAEKKRQEAARARQARLDALPSAAVYRKWWRRFADLEDSVLRLGRRVTIASVIMGIGGFVSTVVWHEAWWAPYALGFALAGCGLLVVSLYSVYFAHVLEDYGATPIRTWAGLTDFGWWAAPFRFVGAIFQTLFLSAFLFGPPLGVWLLFRWFGWF